MTRFEQWRKRKQKEAAALVVRDERSAEDRKAEKKIFYQILKASGKRVKDMSAFELEVWMAKEEFSDISDSEKNDDRWLEEVEEEGEEPHPIRVSQNFEQEEQHRPEDPLIVEAH